MTQNSTRTVMQSFRADISFFSQSMQDPKTVAVACADNTVFLLDMSQNEISRRVTFDHPLTDLEFDPCSNNYMVLIFKNGTMGMYDVQMFQEVSGFTKQNPADRRICFIPGAPGTFITLSDRSSVLNIWNVSQEGCTGTLKTGIGPTISAHILPGTQQVLVAFVDGSVAVFDIPKKMLIWQTSGGHTETVFDCAFSPTDCNVLATCSYDHTVRIWSVQTMQCEKILSGSNSILYSMAWSPDGKMLAASDEHGCVQLYDPKRGVIVKRFHNHSKDERSCRVVWNQDPEKDMLASVANDGTCVVFKVDGTILRVLRHTDGVRGAAWNTFNSDILATSCIKGDIYIWDMSQPTETCLKKTITGHRLCVFNVQWSPLVADWLLSCSDDTTARVWDAATGDCVAELKGHMSKTRGLLWHTTLDNIVITGSWDATMRIWDVKTATCLACVLDHRADVYGITSHPQRPFLIASCSRDTTFRFWNLLDLFPGLLSRAIMGKPLGQYSKDHDRKGTGCVLGGNAFENLREKLDITQSAVKKMSLLFGFFFPMPGIEDLWNLVAAVQASKFDERNALQHDINFHSIVHKLVKDKAQQAEMCIDAKATTVGFKRRDCVIEAAQLHLHAGNFYRYCESMAGLGEWDKAIMVAPAVSVDYWKQLMKKKADWLLSQPDRTVEETPELLLPSGHSQHLVDALIEQERFEQAFSTAAVLAEGGYGEDPVTSSDAAPDRLPSVGHLPKLNPVSSIRRPSKIPSKPSEAAVRIRTSQAEKLFQAGSAILAACCHLSVEDVDQALDKLWMGNELELVVALRAALGLDRDTKVEIQLARKCEAAGDWWAAGEILESLPDGERLLQLLAVRFRFANSSSDHVACFFSDFNLNRPEKYLEAASGSSQSEATVRLHLLGQDPGGACSQLLDRLRQVLANDDWHDEMNELDLLQDCIASMDASSVGDKRWQELRTYECFLGAVKAFREGYWQVAQFLMEATRRFIRREEISFPLCIHKIYYEEARLVLPFHPSTAKSLLNFVIELGATKIKDAAAEIIAELEGRDGYKNLSVPTRSIIPQESRLPSRPPDEERQVSSITGERIQGPVVSIHPLGSKVCLGEAIAVSRVTSLWRSNPRGAVL
ncbi:hypothetical protein BSKO_06040 [Bryopsis sp. KO-2023]|nr:hypothetical protein BSKO_06040 [Bryopsis sp. KO-2023]